MSQTSVLRCPDCRQMVAVADHGETRAAGTGRAVGTDRGGAPIYQCGWPECEAKPVIPWPRERKSA